MNGEDESQAHEAPRSDLPSVGPSFESERVIRRREERAAWQQRLVRYQRLNLAFELAGPHSAGLYAFETGVGREVLRGLLDGGLDLSKLDISQDAEGLWQVEHSEDPVTQFDNGSQNAH